MEREWKRVIRLKQEREEMNTRRFFVVFSVFEFLG